MLKSMGEMTPEKWLCPRSKIFRLDRFLISSEIFPSMKLPSRFSVSSEVTLKRDDGMEPARELLVRNKC